jgi:hypothetical protein
MFDGGGSSPAAIKGLVNTDVRREATGIPNETPGSQI